MIAYDGVNHPYQLFNEDGVSISEAPQNLGENEVYVPISFKSLYDAEIGDTVQVLKDESNDEYVIKGFFEDPYIGSSMMGIKTILMNKDDLDYLLDTYTDDSGYQMNIYKNQNSDLSYMEFETVLNKETNLSSYSSFSLGKEKSFSYMSLLVNIFAGILLAFTIILLIVAFIVLSHSISSSIEFDYVSMGILKAVGFTKGRLSSDGEGLDELFNPYSSDIYISYTDDATQDKAEEVIKSYSIIKNKFMDYSEYISINDNNCMCIFVSNPNAFNSILSGRTCLYENELLVTQYVADDLDIGIGDTVTVSAGNYAKDFIVSGIYQNANDTGTNIAMSFNGYQYVTGKSLENYYYDYELEDGSESEELVDKLNDKFEGKLEANDNTFSGMDTIVSAIAAISLLMYVVAVIFVLIVIYLMCDKIFAREKHDIGIYKAIGLTASQLRIQFAARFAVAAFVGGAVGVGLNLLLTNPCMEALLSLIGISKFVAEFTLAAMAKPIIFIVLVFLVFGYFAARKIKKVEIKDLIVD